MKTKLASSPRARATLVAAAVASFCSGATFAQSATTLPTVTVTARRFAEAQDTLPVGVTVLGADDLRASGATTLGEALARLLGVVARQDLSGGGGEYNLDLRGFGTTADLNQVVVLDGVRLSEPDASTRLPAIPLEAIERVEILRGSGAVLYGEGATGGVISISTKAGAGGQQANGGSVYAAAGSFGLRDVRANAHVGTASGFSIDASGEKRAEDGWRQHSDSDLRAASLAGQWANEWLRLGARIDHDRLDAGLPGALSAQQYAADPRQSVSPVDTTNRNERRSVFGRATLGDWQLAFDAAARDRDVTTVGSYDYAAQVRAHSYSLRARYDHPVAGLRNAFTIGADQNDWRRNQGFVFGGFASSSEASQRTHALYLQDDLTFAGGTRLSLGTRAERLHKENSDAGAPVDDTLHAWEIGLNQPLGSGWTAYGRIGHSFRLPSVDEIALTSSGAALRPQRSQDLELGTRWKNADTSLDARLYRSNLTDEIATAPDAASLFGVANVNLAPTRREGLEVEATQRLSAALRLRANAALRRSTFRSGPFAGAEVPLAPRETASLRAEWTPARGQHVTGGVNWVSSQHPDSDFANACRMPSYTTADLRYALEWKSAEFALGVRNLFDRKFYTYAFGCTAATGQPSSIYPENGRAFTASVRVPF